MDIKQIKLPLKTDTDPHPRLMVGNYGVHAGDCFVALLPEGWTDISLEVDWNTKGPECWYIPQKPEISPIGLFVKER